MSQGQTILFFSPLRESSDVTPDERNMALVSLHATCKTRGRWAKRPRLRCRRHFMHFSGEKMAKGRSRIAPLISALSWDSDTVSIEIGRPHFVLCFTVIACKSASAAKLNFPLKIARQNTAVIKPWRRCRRRRGPRAFGNYRRRGRGPTQLLINGEQSWNGNAI